MIRAQLWIPMDPGPARANTRKQCRCIRAGGKPRASAYTADEYKAAKSQIHTSAKSQIAQAGFPVPLIPSGPVLLRVTVTPARMHRSGPAAGLPLIDADAVAKCVMDALTGAAYTDDAQVVRVDSGKVAGPVPGIRVAIEQTDTPDAE